MFNKNQFLSLQSFVAIPILAINFTLAPFGEFLKMPTARVSAIAENRPLVQDQADNKQREFEEKVQKIEGYFRDKGNLPAGKYARTFVIEAEKANLPWALLPSIAMAESTGFRNTCPDDPENGFGWGSCRIKFNSVEEAIATVAHNLGGKNSNTARHYKDKDVEGILNAYNPPIFNHKYVAIVTSVMKSIENYPINTK